MFLSIGLAWCTCTSSFNATPYGRQCPTAPVQSIKSPIYDCCHKVVAYQNRDVKPGDMQFVQCSCSEKSQAQTKLICNPRTDLYVVAIEEMPKTEKQVFGHIFVPMLLCSEQQKPEPLIPPPLIA